MTEHQSRPYSVPADPSGIEAPHDVLAADEFGIGTRFSRLPPDPTGLARAHDVLAAEEFAMPAGAEPHGDEGRSLIRGGARPRTFLPLLLLASLLVVVALRRRG
jgi:hypothetical protein